ncbi:MAG TPA: heme o synthase [Candidatus Baltobacteraceae bacterium]|nr:heme o synthase [Candidatus Baltobacteraceae bacterium]
MFRAFSLAAAISAFLLAVLGSWVRINGAGMTCPDWPLCHHALVPVLTGGVVLEWSHRLVALVVGVLAIAALWTGWRARRRIAGVSAALAFIAGVFVVQVALGGLTVALANTPWSVVVHWGTAMLLLAGLTALALLAIVAPERIVVRHSLLGGLLTACVAGAFATMLAGSYVSSSGAGLACTSFPACDGTWTGATASQIAQMVHRGLAAAFALLATVTTAIALRGTTPRVRVATALAYALVLLQAFLGAANVVWDLPTPLREGHAANACAVFVAFVVAVLFAAIDGTAPAPVAAHAPARPPVARGALAIVTDYYELSKPRIIWLLLITTYAAMLMAARGLPNLALTFWTLLGGALSAASAGAINCVWDRDIDRLMKRTMMRPVPRGTISARNGLIFATVAQIAGFAMLYRFVNPLAAWLALAGNAYYVVIYTMWLKRITPLNIVIGGAAGSVPPLVGWAAVTGHLGSPAFALFALIFLWTPPHFWALALMTNTDYDKAGIPMLPNVKGVMRTKREIVVYSLVLVGVSLAFFPLHVLGPCYGGCALILGGVFLWDALKVQRDPTKRGARVLFKYSLLYLALMCAAMVADRVLPRIVL